MAAFSATPSTNRGLAEEADAAEHDSTRQGAGSCDGRTRRVDRRWCEAVPATRDICRLPLAPSTPTSSHRGHGIRADAPSATHRATAPGRQDGTLLGRPHRAAHIPQPLCRQDRPRMQRLPTTAPSIRPIRTQSTPSDTFLVNPPSTARFADLPRGNLRGRGRVLGRYRSGHGQSWRHHAGRSVRAERHILRWHGRRSRGPGAVDQAPVSRLSRPDEHHGRLHENRDVQDRREGKAGPQQEIFPDATCGEYFHMPQETRVD